MCRPNRIKPFTPLIVVLCGVLLFTCSCNPRGSHFSQPLEVSTGSPTLTFQTPGEPTQSPLQETPQPQASSAVIETPTKAGELPATAAASATAAFVLTPTSTSPVQSPTATSKSATPLSATQTRTSTPTRTKTLNSTQTKTATPTQPTAPQTGWAGEWTFYLDDGSGGYTMGALQITLNGKEVLGEAVINGVNYEFVGQLNSDNTFIMGDYTKPSGTGWFSWVFLSENQFGGMLDNRFGFCASRNGAERPGQCGHFITS